MVLLGSLSKEWVTCYRKIGRGDKKNNPPPPPMTSRGHHNSFFQEWSAVKSRWFVMVMKAQLIDWIKDCWWASITVPLDLISCVILFQKVSSYFGKVVHEWGTRCNYIRVEVFLRNEGRGSDITHYDNIFFSYGIFTTLSNLVFLLLSPFQIISLLLK